MGSTAAHAEVRNFAALAAADPAAAAKLATALRGKIVVPHQGGQLLVAQDPHRFRVLRAGRRWGKTKLAAREMILSALGKAQSMNWWVANTYKNVRRGYRQVLRQLPRALLAKEPPPATANELILHLKNGSVIEFYSGGASATDAMAGEGVDFVVIDEAALMPEAAWSQIIRPALLDTKGRAIIISTPRGRNWFYKLWQWGQDPKRKLYSSYHFTSYDNPYIDNEEFEDVKESLPEKLFKQEILAEFLENELAIFNLQKALMVQTLAPPSGHLIMGVDLAKEQDFTVLSASREDGMPVYFERFNGLSWPDQWDIIENAHNDLLELPHVEGITVGVDSTGVGDPTFDELDRRGIDVFPVKFSNEWKNKAVKLLGAAVERQEAPLYEEMREEFEAYELHITPHGNMTYEAPSGKHDDMVSAKLVEWWTRHMGNAGDIYVPSEEEWDAEEEDDGEWHEEKVAPDSVRDRMNNPAAWSRV